MSNLPSINIKRIKEVSFLIDEISIGAGANRSIKMEIGQKLGFAFPVNFIELTISIYYYFEDTVPHKKLCEIVVQNIFEVASLVDYKIGDNEIRLPKETISIAFSAAISHTRALLSTHLMGTSLELPFLIDSSEVARHFYPKMFEEKQNTADLIPTHKLMG